MKLYIASYVHKLGKIAKNILQQINNYDRDKKLN